MKIVICNSRCLLVYLSVCLSVNNFAQNFPRICMKLSWKVVNGPVTKWLNSGDDPHHGYGRIATLVRGALAEICTHLVLLVLCTHLMMWHCLLIGWGLYLFSGGAGTPSNTKSPGPRPTTIPSGVVIHPAVWPQYTNVTDRTDNGSIA